jgi:N-acetylmuramoyl-L-alanine amidase
MFPELPPLPIEDTPLAYVAQLEQRPLSAIEGIVIHCTELPDLASARDFGERVLYPESGTGNSGHYYIDRDGRVLRFVEPARVAHHVRGYNPATVGIELVNTGRHPHWFDSDHQQMDEPYPAAQIAALIALLRVLSVELPGLRWIAGHEDLDRQQIPAANDPSVLIARKRDPGPLFPWSRVLREVPLPRHGAVDPPGATAPLSDDP